MSWDSKLLGEVVDLTQGFCINKKSNHLVVDEGIPLLRITDMINSQQKIFISPEIPKKFIANKDDIIFTRTGQVGLVFRNQYGIIHNNCFTVSPLNQELSKDYLYWFLRSEETITKAKGLAAGAAQPDLNHGAFKSISITYPQSLQTQKRIADILSAYDDLIENNLKRIKLLEQAAQNIYKEWFVNLRFPGYENTPINEETGLPLGWEEKSASDLFNIKGGTQPPKSQWSDEKKDGYVRMVQIRDYKTDTHIAYVKDDKKLRRCGKEDIMIARYGASVGRICWGIEGVYNVALAKAIPYDDAYLEYIRWYVKSYFFQESLLGMTQRAAQDGFNKDTFKSLTAVIPNINVVTKFDNIVYPMLKQMELLKNKNQKLKAARDILLPRLMNRTIEV